MFGEVKNDPIYSHTKLDMGSVQKIVPLMESAFKDTLSGYQGNRSAIRDEKVQFLAKQYANRLRESNLMGVTPLNEDASIFKGLGNITKMFESVSTPSNIVGMGNVSNPMNGTAVSGGMWNPAYAPGSGDIPSYVFGLQAHIANYCVGFDLIPTIQVDTPKIVINYVDTVYGGGALDSVTDQPDYLDFLNAGFTASWIKASNLVRGTSKLALYPTTALGDGAAQVAIETRFVMGSSVEAGLTLEVLSTGTINETTGVYTAVNSISVKGILDAIETAVAGGQETGVYVLGGAKISDDTHLVTKARYTSATRNTIIEAGTNNNSQKGMSRAEHEKGPAHKLNIISMDKQLEMNGFEIEADTTNIQIKDMASMGINVIARLYNGVQNQLVQSLNEVILSHLYAMGVEHAKGAYASQGINHSLYIDTPANTQISMSDILGNKNVFPFVDMLGNDASIAMGNVKNSLASAGYENQDTHAKRLFARIALVLEYVGQQNRIAPPDSIVVGGEIAATLKTNATYSIVPQANTLTQTPSLHFNGTIFGNVNVYKNPKDGTFADPRILFVRRGNDNDPGSKFLAYDLASSRQTIVENTMAEKIRVWSRFAIADVGFFPFLNYYTCLVKNNYGWS